MKMTQVLNAAAQAAWLAICDVLEAHASLAGDRIISVPWTGRAATSDGPAVWPLNPGTLAVHLTPIEVAGCDDATIAIASGLADGTQVSGADTNKSFEGATVRPVKPKPKDMRPMRWPSRFSLLVPPSRNRVCYAPSSRKS